MTHPPQARNIVWFGKLPCVGDFCSHNMNACLLSELDDWLSTAMQTGLNTRGGAWMQAYYETPMHGFVWGHNTLPALGTCLVIGILMPSVDRAGRAFPFVMLEQLEVGAAKVLPCAALADWFFQAHALCAGALNEEWPLEKLNEMLTGLPPIDAGPGTGSWQEKTLLAQAEYTHWFRIDYAGQFKPAMQHHGLPRAEAFDTLLGLNSSNS